MSRIFLIYYSFHSLKAKHMYNYQLFNNFGIPPPLRYHTTLSQDPTPFPNDIVVNVKRKNILTFANFSFFAVIYRYSYTFVDLNEYKSIKYHYDI